MADHMNELQGMLLAAEAFGEHDTASALRAAIIALSHAAGQEVDVPHPLGERHAAIEKALKGQTLLLMSRDHVNDQKKPLAEIKFGMSTDLGVLFCLADTEAPMPVDPAVARSEGEIDDAAIKRFKVAFHKSATSGEDDYDTSIRLGLIASSGMGGGKS